MKSPYRVPSSQGEPQRSADADLWPMSIVWLAALAHVIFADTRSAVAILLVVLLPCMLRR